MGEFFVARAARGRGHARAFAEAVVRSHPGRWEIAFQEDNTRASEKTVACRIGPGSIEP